MCLTSAAEITMQFTNLLTLLSLEKAPNQKVVASAAEITMQFTNLLTLLSLEKAPNQKVSNDQ